MKTIKFSNEKGNPLSAVRKAMKEAVIDNLALGEASFDRNERGEVYTLLAYDEVTGNPIYAKVEVTISTLDLPGREVQAKDKADTEVIDVSGLFD